jgi:crotonobetaine/carnitine-CoA ligase
MHVVDISEMELEKRVITEILADRAADTPDRPFVHIAGRTYSYGQMYEASGTVARALAANGVGPGQRVVMMLTNREEFLFTWFGTAMIGATIVPINPEWKGETLEYILTDAAPAAMILTSELTHTVAPVLPELTDLKLMVLCDTEAVEPAEQIQAVQTLAWAELVEQGADAEGLRSGPRFDDVLAILYSSGTTGRPKGIVMPHAHVYSFGIQWSRATNFSGVDHLYAPTPLFYMQATVLGVVPTLMAGAQIHIAPRFSASHYWEGIRESGATIAHGQFSLIPLLLKQPPNPLDRQHNCERIFIAKSNLEFEERFGVRIVEIYGSSESNIVAYNPWDAHKPGSAGKPAPNFEVIIVDDEDRELPQGEVGEIVARPREPYLISGGYYHRPEVTLEALRNMWFHCGDRGYYDEDGYLFFVDRKKDVIRRKGENISSAEVERQVNTHPDVLESAAVPVPAETAEDEVKVFVVRRPGASLEPEQLITYLQGILPRFMVPRYVEFIETMPKTGSLKIEKFKLREASVLAATWDREVGDYAH